MWRFRRFRLLALSVLLVAATVTVVVLLRKIAPPEPARLLPGGDAFAYVNLEWARRATILTGLPQVKRSPDYEKFVQESGVDFERDLEQAALAAHYPAPGASSQSPEAAPRYSAVLVGHLNATRLASYFRRFARSTDTEQGVEIFNIPLDGQTLRAAILGPDSVALSNHDDPEVIRGVVVRSRKRASPFGGPGFLRAYYRRVPLASMAWVIARVDPRMSPAWSPTAHSDETVVVPNFHLLQNPAVVVVSARVIRDVHLRAEAFTKNADEARDLTDKVSALLALVRFSEAETPSGGPDAEVKAFFQSLQVSQDKDRAVLTATMPLGFLRKVFRDPGVASEVGDLPGTTASRAATSSIAAPEVGSSANPPKAAAAQPR